MRGGDMDLRVFVATFMGIFLAELADKTQLVGITMASKTAKPWAVFLGSVCAYALITGFSVWLGAFLGKYLQPQYLRFGGAAIFIFIGILMFFEKL